MKELIVKEVQLILLPEAGNQFLNTINWDGIQQYLPSKKSGWKEGFGK